MVARRVWRDRDIFPSFPWDGVGDPFPAIPVVWGVTAQHTRGVHVGVAGF